VREVSVELGPAQQERRAAAQGKCEDRVEPRGVEGRVDALVIRGRPGERDEVGDVARQRVQQVERVVAGPADDVYCANVRGAGRFAVTDAYEDWCDVGEDDVMRLIER
jgi:hypothetical protein